MSDQLYQRLEILEHKMNLLLSRMVIVSVSMRREGDNESEDKLFSLPFDACAEELKHEIVYYLRPRVGDITNDSLTTLHNMAIADDLLLQLLPGFLIYEYRTAENRDSVDSARNSARNAEYSSEYGDITSRNPRAS